MKIDQIESEIKIETNEKKNFERALTEMINEEKNFEAMTSII